jgi:hypothetical protein
MKKKAGIISIGGILGNMDFITIIIISKIRDPVWHNVALAVKLNCSDSDKTNAEKF